MKEYKRITEDLRTDANDFAEQIQKAILAIFPHSFVSARFSSNIYPVINVDFALGKDKSEWLHGYKDNDPARTSFMIGGKSRFGITREGEITEPLVCELKIGGIYTKPEPGSYMALGKIKLPFRKLTSDPIKILHALIKYFTNLKVVLNQNVDNLTKDQIALIGHKF